MTFCNLINIGFLGKLNLLLSYLKRGLQQAVKRRKSVITLK